MEKTSSILLKDRIDRFCSLCREHGLKVTHQRLEIYRVLIHSKDHPTAEDVHHRIKNTLPTISLDTVYRTLGLFEEHGLIDRVQQLDDKGRFDSNLEHHHHFICIRCKKIVDFSWPEFDRLPRPDSLQQWSTIKSEKVEFRGICNECAEKKNH